MLEPRNINEISRRKIFKLFRENEKTEMYKFPIFDKFNPATRAIQHLWKFEKQGGHYLEGLELFLFLNNEISNIVNSQV